MKRHLPFALTTLRLLLGPIALACALVGVTRFIYLPILITPTLSDIFDGVLARKFGVATPALRRYDSITDIIYYLFILAAAWLLCKPVIAANLWLIALMLASEAGAISICLIRFGKFPATHSFLAKFYGLCLLAGLIALLVFNAGSWAIIALAVVALVTNSEIIAMHVIAKSPPVDVPCIFALMDKVGTARCAVRTPQRGVPTNQKGRPIERPFQLPQTPGQAEAGAAGFAAVLFALIAVFLRLM
jgi:CDP-diacylglycerol--glycerol-3-phosphate 3-phosphatidyltransferase